MYVKADWREDHPGSAGARPAPVRRDEAVGGAVAKAAEARNLAALLICKTST